MDLHTSALARRLLAILVIAVALVVSACASGAASPADNGTNGGAAAASAAAAGGNGGNGGRNDGADNGANGNGNGGDAGSGNGNGNAGTDEGADGGSAGGGGQEAAFQDVVRLVYDGTMSVRVEDLEAAVRAGRDAVLEAGGYVAASRQSTEETSATASVTYRIPADRWEVTLDRLRGLGEHLGEEIASTEVTAQIVDLEARIRNLRVHETGVQRLADQATTFEDILDGQERLARVRQEIEQLDAQLANLENRADLGTLTVTFGTEVVAVAKAAEAAQAAWDGPGEIARATATLIGMLQSLASVGIWVGIVVLPALAILLAVALAVRLIVRRTGLLERVAVQPVHAGPPLPATQPIDRGAPRG
jgi:Domain of unknown function (DUF4349)